MKGARVFNASSIQISVPVVLPNVTCRVMDPAGFKYTLGSNDTNNQDMGSNSGIHNGTYLNITHTDLASYRCKDSWFPCGDFFCPDNGTRCIDSIPSFGYDFDHDSLTAFVNLLYASELENAPLEWAYPTGWPDPQTLIQAVATRDGGAPLPIPDLIAIYGFWGPQQLSLNGIRCYFDIRAGWANVSYHLNTTEVIGVQVEDDTLSYVPNTGNCSPWNGPRGDQLESFLPDNSSLWATALNGSNASIIYSLDGAAALGERISRIYNNYYTQYYNVALRESNTTDSTNKTVGYVWDDNWQRLAQSRVSTRILQALLAIMWFCTTIALFLFDTKDLLPKNPCSIAAQASLLADSQFLNLIPACAENATAEELMQMTPFVDREFSMGWWDDENGGRRFGIDVGVADFDKDGNDAGNEEEQP
jgi:hypothetical protein